MDIQNKGSMIRDSLVEGTLVTLNYIFADAVSKPIAPEYDTRRGKKMYNCKRMNAAGFELWCTTPALGFEPECFPHPNLAFVAPYITR